MNEVRKNMWNQQNSIHIAPLLTEIPPTEQKLKCRLVYSEKGIDEIEYKPYQRRHIESLRIVEHPTINYTYKSTDRSLLNSLASQKGTADEILIVKNGVVTDTSFTNIAFFDGKDWITPRQPLLKGTMRQWLLDNNFIHEGNIYKEDIQTFKCASIFNAMIALKEIVIDVNKIVG